MDTPAVKQWKAKKLAQFGYDPTQFDLQPDGTVVPLAPAQVETASSAGDSPLTTAGKSAAWSLPDVAGGLVGAGLAAQGLSLGLDATGVGMPAGIAGHLLGGAAMLAGGALGGYGASKLKGAVAPGMAQNVAESAELNPRAATLGNVGAQLVGMTPSLGVMRAAGGGLRNLATGVPVAAKEVEALANVGVGGAISGGMNVGQQLAGDEPFSAGELAGETLLGGALHQPTKLGTKMSLGTFKPFVENRTDFVREGKDVMADARGGEPIAYTDEIKPGDAARLAAADQELGLPRKPGEPWDAYVNRLAAERHGTTVNRAKVVDPAGGERYGYRRRYRDDAGVAVIGAGPRQFHNTAPHELIHGYIRDVMQHGSASERAFIAKAAKAAGSEEALAQTGGESFLRRLAGDDSIIGDVTANIRTKLGRGTQADAARLTANRLVRGRGIEGMPLAEAGAERWRARPTSVYTDEQGENPRTQERPPNAEFQGEGDFQSENNAATGGADLKKLLKLLRNRQDRGNVTEVAGREVIQNSVDALYSRKIAKPEIQYSTEDLGDDASQFMLADNAGGMLPDFVLTKYLSMGYSSKGVGDGGSLGIAKGQFLGNAKEFEIRTIATDPRTKKRYLTTVLGTGESFGDAQMPFTPNYKLGEVHKIGNDLQYKIEDVTDLDPIHEDGTMLRLVYDKASGDSYAARTAVNRTLQYNQQIAATRLGFSRYSANEARVGNPLLEGTGKYFVEFNNYAERAGQVYDSRQNKYVTPVYQKHETIELPSSTLEVFSRENSPNHTTRWANVAILSNGIHQFDMSLQLSNEVTLPNDIVVNVKAKVGGQDKSYPFAIDRSSVTDDVANAINKYFNEIGAKLRAEQLNKYKAAKDSAPRMTAAGLQDVSMLDTSGAIPPEMVQYIGSSPEVAQSVRALRAINQAVNKLLARRFPKQGFTNSQMRGIFMGTENAYGVRFGKQGGEGEIYYDPFLILAKAEADAVEAATEGGKPAIDDIMSRWFGQAVGVSLHENLHQNIGTEGEGLSRGLTFTAGEVAMAKDAVASVMDIYFDRLTQNPKIYETLKSINAKVAQYRNRDTANDFISGVSGNFRTEVRPEDGVKFQGGDQTESPEFANWFGDWRAVLDLNAKRAAGKPVDPAAFTAALAGRSKVVDGEGRPLRVYHGTQKSGFSSFDMEKTEELGMHFGTRDQAADFVLDPNEASSRRDWMAANSPDEFSIGGGYWPKNRADAMMPVYLNIKNPLRTPDVYASSPAKFLNWALKAKAMNPKVLTEAYEMALGHDNHGAWRHIKAELESMGHDGLVYINDAEGNLGDPSNEAWVAFKPEQIKSAIGNRGTFDQTNADIRYQGGEPTAGTEELRRLNTADVDWEFLGSGAKEYAVRDVFVRGFESRLAKEKRALFYNDDTEQISIQPKRGLMANEDAWGRALTSGDRNYGTVLIDADLWRNAAGGDDQARKLFLNVLKHELGHIDDGHMVADRTRADAERVANDFQMLYQGGTPARDPVTGLEVKPWWVRAREAFSNLTEGLPRRMENTGLPNHIYAAGKMRQLVARQREMAAGYNDHVQVELLRLNDAERARLREVLLTEDGSASAQINMRGTLTNKLKIAYDAVRSTYRKMAEDQIRAGHLLADGTERGINDQSFPNVLRSDVARVLFNEPGSEQWNRLRSEFVEYNRQRFLDQGMSAVEANEAALSAAEKYSGTMKAPSREASLRFGGTDLPANSKLPAGWIEQDLSRLWERYTQQFARSRARFDVFDADPRMRSLTGQSTTANDASPLPEQLMRDNPSLMTVKDFKTFLDVYERGGMPGSSEAVLPSIGRFVNSLLISGPRTKLTDALTTVFKGMPHVGVRQMPGLIMNIANFRQSLDNSFRNGLNNRTGQIVMREVLGAGEEVANSFDKAAEAVVKYTGSEKLEQLARGLAQNVGEYIARVNRPLALNGDQRALRLLEHMGPDWRTLDDATLGGRVAKLFQGNYDVTNLPPWMFDSPVAPFLTMAKWSVEQTNNFRKFAYEPALKGDYAPLIATMVAGLGGGFALNEMRELMAAKKEQNPTFSELSEATDETAAAGELFAKFVKYAQITGTLGIIGEMTSQAMDAANGRLPQGFRYPVAEFAADSVQRAHSAGSAIIDGAPVLEVLAAFSGDMARGHVQMAQFTDGLLGKMGVDATGSATRTADANARRDYRVFNRMNGYPTQLSPMRFAPYAGLEQKRFDRADIGEAAQMLPGLIARAAEQSGGDPEILRSSLNKLRTAPIAGMPSATASPLRFARYLNWMRQMQGSEVADTRAVQYYENEARRRAKSAMVPRI